MTGLSKTIIGIIIVGMLTAVIGLTWFFTRRSLVSALTPPALPSSATQTSATESTAKKDSTSDTATQTTQTETPPTVTKVLIPLVKGWNFKSIPYILSPNKGSIVFSKLASSEAYFLENQEYTSFLDSGDVGPGQGLALHSTAGEVLEIIANQATAVDETKPFTIALKKGWNLIGNPFAKDINWNPTIDTGTQKITYEKALSENIISKTYAWSPSSESYLSLDANQTLKKYQAVFIKAGGAIKLIVSSE